MGGGEGEEKKGNRVKDKVPSPSIIRLHYTHRYICSSTCLC